MYSIASSNCQLQDAGLLGRRVRLPCPSPLAAMSSMCILTSGSQSYISKGV